MHYLVFCAPNSDPRKPGVARAKSYQDAQNKARLGRERFPESLWLACIAERIFENDEEKIVVHPIH